MTVVRPEDYFIGIVRELVKLPKETEWFEFKRNNDNPEEIGEYISALANSAALLGKASAYLVWGIDNETHEIVGTKINPSTIKIGQEELENWLLHLLSPKINVRFVELIIDEHRVVMLEIDAAFRHPIRFKNNEFIRIGSYKKKLRDFPEKERQLWRMLAGEDWSAMVCEEATLEDLDARAIVFARQQYKEKHPTLAEEVDSWEDMTFLNKAKVCRSGKVTNTAIILLGKSEATHHITPARAQITWVLKDASGAEKDYQHFEPPFILAVTEVFGRIRNLTYRYLPNQSLFPTEVRQYEPWVLRETLNNCIAHQDYSKAGRINIVEGPETLLFINLGHFLPGSVEEVIYRDAPPDQYRNPFLAQAMVNLNMIDTIGSGIKRMFNVQRKRFFPMPDYDLSDLERVQVRIFGKVLDENYTRVLIEMPDLDLRHVIALDKVQKKKTLSDDEFRALKSQKLIEGRRPNNLFVSAKIAAVTGEKADYIKHRAFDKEHYKNMVVSYLERFKEAKREDIEKLLLDKISDALSEEQKTNRVKNLLQEMRKEGAIKPVGPKRSTRWILSNSDE